MPTLPREHATSRNGPHACCNAISSPRDHKSVGGGGSEQALYDGNLRFAGRKTPLGLNLEIQTTHDAAAEEQKQ